MIKIYIYCTFQIASLLCKKWNGNPKAISLTEKILIELYFVFCKDDASVPITNISTFHKVTSGYKYVSSYS